MLDVGEVAPEFELPNQDGRLVRRSNFADQWLVIYFYPRANTNGCTIEAREFSTYQQDFAALGVDIVGISDDSVADLDSFAAEYDLEFDLLSDGRGEVATLYDSYGEKHLFGKRFDGVFRNTYVIDPEGCVAFVFENVSPEGHAQSVYSAVASRID